ncbi:hypothetical protein GGS23DRAFT_465876 [Durotheca rogersii]|uniref:uncharacterized protein n=1 Tax=Durotheca rogersii TaxID=419775 RepID=UPI00221F07DB|nr:uncharacterized protein GGS23DRAFT_465876 [Durotheca rogersii]KAI5864834.1 hypothetical protein GGS23DRAFT_465876 [Durotheca rogersii]
MMLSWLNVLVGAWDSRAAPCGLGRHPTGQARDSQQGWLRVGAERPATQAEDEKEKRESERTRRTVFGPRSPRTEEAMEVKKTSGIGASISLYYRSIDVVIYG